MSWSTKIEQKVKTPINGINFSVVSRILDIWWESNIRWESSKQKWVIRTTTGI